MPTPPPNASMATLIAPLVVIALVIMRNMRARRLRIESLWLAPTLIIVAVGLQFSQEGTPTPLSLGVDIGAFVIGAVLGWWRARFTHITIDPATHQLTSRASPIGMLVVLALFALRYVLRVYAVQNAGSIGLPMNVVADGALVISVGLVCAQRLEIALRATRLLNEARDGVAPPSS